MNSRDLVYNIAAAYFMKQAMDCCDSCGKGPCECEGESEKDEKPCEDCGKIPCRCEKEDSSEEGSED